ncbi:uncharacterized protein MELLADRAFT_86961 [Melampsora larici-populina 98AG31]|uniref:Uncharacterized protein n=1 Tax=Melampsora larici-populina (strain 98AG31 / pathotype 3-4-7) TaxID=747676 RepID=F4R405_MELLP|nr:uncharacterized protein MELLADRAFT_86961 [Melampsora larici-populina 98AG31]EGG12715.1 hypothetical protein MELLADRAFT_86961 [Melampsora larici-populina 98AG31]
MAHLNPRTPLPSDAVHINHDGAPTAPTHMIHVTYTAAEAAQGQIPSGYIQPFYPPPGLLYPSRPQGGQHPPPAPSYPPQSYPTSAQQPSGGGSHPPPVPVSSHPYLSGSSYPGSYVFTDHSGSSYPGYPSTTSAPFSGSSYQPPSGSSHVAPSYCHPGPGIGAPPSMFAHAGNPFQTDSFYHHRPVHFDPSAHFHNRPFSQLPPSAHSYSQPTPNLHLHSKIKEKDTQDTHSTTGTAPSACSSQPASTPTGTPIMGLPGTANIDVPIQLTSDNNEQDAIQIVLDNNERDSDWPPIG